MIHPELDFLQLHFHEVDNDARDDNDGAHDSPNGDTSLGPWLNKGLHRSILL